MFKTLLFMDRGLSYFPQMQQSRLLWPLPSLMHTELHLCRCLTLCKIAALHQIDSCDLRWLLAFRFMKKEKWNPRQSYCIYSSESTGGPLCCILTLPPHTAHYLFVRELDQPCQTSVPVRPICELDFIKVALARPAVRRILCVCMYFPHINFACYSWAHVGSLQLFPILNPANNHSNGSET